MTLSLSSLATKEKKGVPSLFPFTTPKKNFASYSLSLFGLMPAFVKVEDTFFFNPSSSNGKIFPFRQRNRYGVEPAIAGFGSGRLTSLLRVWPEDLSALASKPFTFLTLTSTDFISF